jgi:hypothetical protein
VAKPPTKKTAKPQPKAAPSKDKASAKVAAAPKGKETAAKDAKDEAKKKAVAGKPAPAGKIAKAPAKGSRSPVRVTMRTTPTVMATRTRTSSRPLPRRARAPRARPPVSRRRVRALKISSTWMTMPFRPLAISSMTTRTS